MKIKTAWLSEMRGSLGRPYAGGLSCFRTDKYGNIVGLKSPSGARGPAGSQAIYRHQLHILPKYWTFLTPEGREEYILAAHVHRTTPYNEFVRQNYPVGFLKLLSEHDTYTGESNKAMIQCAKEKLLLSDHIYAPQWLYVDFKFSLIKPPFEITTAALGLYYYMEEGGNSEGKLVDCHMITEAWDEKTTNYYNQPTVAGAETSHSSMPAVNNWVWFDVTPDINNHLSGTPCFGWRLKYHTQLPEPAASWDRLAAIQYTGGAFWPVLKLNL